MGPRPAPLNLNKNVEQDELRAPRYPNFQLDLPSPRPGDVPPALSPLDAFALHSRMLQKKFDEEAEAGRRLSRLPHHTVAKELASRPSYFSLNENGDGAMEEITEVQEDSRPNTRGGIVAETSTGSKDRPMSQYPMLGRVSRLDDERAGTPFFDAREDQPSRASQSYFVAPRTTSPEPSDPKVNVEAPSPLVPSLTSSMDSLSSNPPPRTQADRLSKMSQTGLLPARSSHVPRSPRSMQSSIRAVRQDSGDDDTASQYGVASTTLSPRKYSGSSGMSQPHSPFTPSFTHFAHRSPSMTSEHSLNGFQHSPRPAMNFSRPDRPMSPETLDVRSSMDSRRSFDYRPSTEAIRRQASNTSEVTQMTASTPPQSRNGLPDDIPRPFAVDNNASDSDVESNAGRTYTYSKFTLPRGRNVDRESSAFRTSWIHRQFNWDDDEPAKEQEQLRQPEVKEAHVDQPPVNAVVQELPASSVLPARPAFGHAKKSSGHFFTSSQPSSPTSARASIFAEIRRGRERAFSSANRSHSADPRGNTSRPKTSHTPSASIATDSTDRTVMPPTPAVDAQSLSLDVTPEDHLEIGIQAHTLGQTNKSTYHLRLAAKAGLPTAMVLYALACRHGWGMRANPEEGVQWLQKAIDGSKLEEHDLDITLANASRRNGNLNPITDAAERKKRKAQFALAVYELGISYANGWGCPKDRMLALKCYEIAGKWGDCDALAEAGYCYTQGHGCKKDMHKAAQYYRRAAAGGMSMAGNSWIYKEKYNESNDKKKGNDSASFKDGKDSTRRARSRSIWGRPKKEK